MRDDLAVARAHTRLAATAVATARTVVTVDQLGFADPPGVAVRTPRSPATRRPPPSRASWRARRSSRARGSPRARADAAARRTRAGPAPGRAGTPRSPTRP